MTNSQQPTEEQKKEFWERFGFKQLPQGKSGWHYEKCLKVMNWMPPGETETYHSLNRLPRIDLNNLFKWAVPKLGIVKLTKSDHHLDYIATVVDYNLNKESTRANPNPALALFWAIWEVIHA